MTCVACGAEGHTPETCPLFKQMTGVRYDAVHDWLEWHLCGVHDLWSTFNSAECSECKGGDKPPRTADGAIFCRMLHDGLYCVVYPLNFGDARLCRSHIDDSHLHDSYYYSTHARAIEAARVWTGEGDPLDGWYRNVATDRWRKDGDPLQETRGRPEWW